MSLEIERRFLVQGDEWKLLIKQEQNIEQGYISTNFEDWVSRVRISNEIDAKLTLKKSQDGLLNHEFEYAIPIEDAKNILNLTKFKLTKKRFALRLSPGLWVIDCFLNKNKPLIIAEVELAKKESEIIKPNWCGKELTGIKQFSNACLSTYPICNWSEEEKKKFALN